MCPGPPGGHFAWFLSVHPVFLTLKETLKKNFQLNWRNLAQVAIANRFVFIVVVPLIVVNAWLNTNNNKLLFLLLTQCRKICKRACRLLLFFSRAHALLLPNMSTRDVTACEASHKREGEKNIRQRAACVRAASRKTLQCCQFYCFFFNNIFSSKAIKLWKDLKTFRGGNQSVICGLLSFFGIKAFSTSQILKTPNFLQSRWKGGVGTHSQEVVNRGSDLLMSVVVELFRDRVWGSCSRARASDIGFSSKPLKNQSFCVVAGINGGGAAR